MKVIVGCWLSLWVGEAPWKFRDKGGCDLTKVFIGVSKCAFCKCRSRVTSWLAISIIEVREEGRGRAVDMGGAV
jgi:hypothetical protein